MEWIRICSPDSYSSPTHPLLCLYKYTLFALSRLLLRFLQPFLLLLYPVSIDGLILQINIACVMFVFSSVRACTILVKYNWLHFVLPIRVFFLEIYTFCAFFFFILFFYFLFFHFYRLWYDMYQYVCACEFV